MTPDQPAPTVYVIDDDASLRASLADLLDSVSLHTRVFASVQDFLTAPRGEGPACLILDVRMPGQSGTDFHQQMERLGVRLPVIFITGHGDIAMGVKAIKDGAVDFLTKPFRDQDLLDAVQVALERDRQRLAQAVSTSSLQDRWRSLTPGEREVVRLVVRGQLNKQIAAELDVKEITVKVRRAKSMKKMGAASLTDLVRMTDELTALEG
ncbi:FixJ family two-component response regulator [Brevundimonas nasdae]|uniref:response regulator transcription factor n=1 Tax=Brevundimonas nasdae TaxID=172043 RepID=UPI001911F5B8|nr:response regulator transcription factor [Brevundimonas nasdae]MBK6024297.1 response regulator transcription factor [Brevundimonas nasdae]MDQ0450954.1 FixJ family two-component response regulator [Brevundimonas nasdae]